LNGPIFIAVQIPEPATWALLVLGAVTLLDGLRLRHQSSRQQHLHAKSLRQFLRPRRQRESPTHAGKLTPPSLRLEAETEPLPLRPTPQSPELSCFHVFSLLQASFGEAGEPLPDKQQPTQRQYELLATKQPKREKPP
jgi:hypothetical protein